MINLSLTEQETTALLQLIDAGVKTTGIQAVTAAAILLAKIDAASKARAAATAHNVEELKPAA
jgi:G3E family GTPase